MLMYDVADVAQSLYDPMFGASVLSWVTDGVEDKHYVNTAETRAIGVNTASTGKLGNAIIGYTTKSPGSLDYSGTMSTMAIYSKALSAAEVAHNVTVMRARAVARGVTLGYTNTASGRVLIFDGDSITANYSWFSDMTLAQTWHRYSYAITGNTLLEITTRQYSVYSVSANATINANVIFAGTNDLSLADAATVFARLVTHVSDCVSLGMKVIIMPMLSRSLPTWDASKNTYNSLIAAHSWPSGVSFVPGSDLPHMVPDGSYADTSYFFDGTHPTSPVGTGEIMSALAPYIDALG
jgi:lysophospholipase L1-like esterase